MFVLVTLGKWEGQKDFERSVVRALGRRGHLISVSSGGKRETAYDFNRELQVARTERWVLWWHPPSEYRGDKPDVASLVRGLDPALQ